MVRYNVDSWGSFFGKNRDTLIDFAKTAQRVFIITWHCEKAKYASK